MKLSKQTKAILTRRSNFVPSFFPQGPYTAPLDVVTSRRNKASLSAQYLTLTTVSPSDRLSERWVPPVWPILGVHVSPNWSCILKQYQIVMCLSRVVSGGGGVFHAWKWQTDQSIVRLVRFDQLMSRFCKPHRTNYFCTIQHKDKDPLVYFSCKWGRPLTPDPWPFSPNPCPTITSTRYIPMDLSVWVELDH